MLHPDLMAYMLLFPLIIFFGLPGLLLPMVLLREKLAAAGLRAPTGEHRECPRQIFDGVIAHVSDGVHCSRVAVNNMSERGICFTCPPERLDQNADRLAVLLTAAGKNFQLQIKPRWKEQRGEGQSIGATIVDSLGSWDEFAGKAVHSRLMRAA